MMRLSIQDKGIDASQVLAQLALIMTGTRSQRQRDLIHAEVTDALGCRAGCVSAAPTVVGMLSRSLFIWGDWG
jgi:hypothetical protein